MGKHACMHSWKGRPAGAQLRLSSSSLSERNKEYLIRSSLPTMCACMQGKADLLGMPSPIPEEPASLGNAKVPAKMPEPRPFTPRPYSPAHANAVSFPESMPTHSYSCSVSVSFLCCLPHLKVLVQNP